MPRSGERFVATILFADIVGSTEMAAEAGDRRWNAILGTYYDTARRETRRFRGREVDTAGDGYFAAFDAPNDGVRAAAAIVESMWAKGIPVRAGLHAGECEVIGKKVGGIAVHIGARVAGLAGAGEIVVTSTVRDLAAGSALRFDPMGTRELKGVPGEWSVYEVASDTPRPPLPGMEVSERERPRDGGRRRMALIAGIVAAVAAVAVAVPLLFLGGSNDEKGHGGTGTPAASGAAPSATASGGSSSAPGDEFVGVVAFDSTSGDETAREPIPLHGDATVTGHDITSGFEFIWVADYNAGTLSKLNSSTGTVVATINVRYPTAVLVHGSDVWVASGTPGCAFCDLVRIDASTNLETDSYEIDACCGGMAIDGGSLWVLGVSSLYRVNLETGAFKRFDGGGDAIAASGGRIWMLSQALGTLTPFDERTRVPGEPIPLSGSAPTLMASGFGALWITDPVDGTLTRVPVDGRGGVDTVPVGRSPLGVAVGAGSVWVANADDGTVSRIDPFEVKVVDTIPVGGRNTRLTVAFGSVWTTVVPIPRLPG